MYHVSDLRGSRRPQVFDYANVLDDSVGIHYPVHEIPSRVKLSCCTWNSYMKSNLIVSDYEGTVTLHDVAVGAEVRFYSSRPSIRCCPRAPLPPLLLNTCAGIELSRNGAMFSWMYLQGRTS